MSLQDAIDSTISYLQENMQSVSDGILLSENIISEADTVARTLPTIISSIVGTAFDQYVGEYVALRPLVQFLVTTNEKSQRDTIRDDLYSTLHAGRNSIENVGTLTFRGLRNLDPTVTEATQVKTLVQYYAVIEVELYDY